MNSPDGQPTPPTKLRIVHVATLAGPENRAGGVWAVVEAQRAAASASSLVDDVRVVAGWLGRRRVPAPADHTYVRLRRLPGSRSIRGLWGVRTPWTIRRALVAGADVVHVHLCRDLFTMIALAVMPRRSRPLVVAQCHGMLAPPAGRAQKLYDLALTKHLLHRVDRFLALTAAEEHQLSGLGIARARIERIHNAVEEPPERWSAAAAEPLVVFAARLHARKRPMDVVLAAQELQTRGRPLRFVIAGPDAGEGARVRQAIAELGLDRVHVVGSLDPGQVAALLARCGAFVLPSVDEPYPMVVLEAAAVGAPMVISSDTGVSALLREEGAALVVEPRATALAEALDAVTGDPRLQRRLGEAARGAFEKHWTIAGLTGRLDQLYGEARRAR